MSDDHLRVYSILHGKYIVFHFGKQNVELNRQIYIVYGSYSKELEGKAINNRT